MVNALIFLDAGHGGRDSGAVGTLNGKQIKEEDITLAVVKYAEQYLLAHYDIKDELIAQSRTADVDVSLGQRTSAANKADADIFVSVHVNAAANKSAEGFETFVFPNPDKATQTLQNTIHSEVFAACKKFGITRDRGKKTANFQVLRETEMPAVLIELGFISNATEAKILMDPAFQKEAGKAIAIACAKVTKLKEKVTTPEKPPTSTQDKVYRVIVDGKQVGAYGKYDNVLKEVKSYLGKAKTIEIEEA